MGKARSGIFLSGGALGTHMKENKKEKLKLTQWNVTKSKVFLIKNIFPLATKLTKFCHDSKMEKKMRILEEVERKR